MRTVIILSFDKKDLERKRYLRLQQGQGRYNIPNQPVYQPAHQFLKKYEQTRYPFIMQQLLHATAVKMLRMPNPTPYSKTLFAAGGLYLALDQKHPDLAIKPIFGDFTSGFSHQFGVALAVMSMSEAFGAIPQK